MTTVEEQKRAVLALLAGGQHAFLKYHSMDPIEHAWHSGLEKWAVFLPENVSVSDKTAERDFEEISSRIAMVFAGRGAKDVEARFVRMESRIDELYTLAQRCVDSAAAYVSKFQELVSSREERDRCIWIPITTLYPAPYHLRENLTAVVIGGEEGHEAGLFELNLFGSGDTEYDAVESLKSIIVDTYKDLSETPDSKLGPGPARQKQLLAHLVVPD